MLCDLYQSCTVQCANSNYTSYLALLFGQNLLCSHCGGGGQSISHEKTLTLNIVTESVCAVTIPVKFIQTRRLTVDKEGEIWWHFKFYNTILQEGEKIIWKSNGDTDGRKMQTFLFVCSTAKLCFHSGFYITVLAITRKIYMKVNSLLFTTWNCSHWKTVNPNFWQAWKTCQLSRNRISGHSERFIGHWDPAHTACQITTNRAVIQPSSIISRVKLGLELDRICTVSTQPNYIE